MGEQITTPEQLTRWLITQVADLAEMPADEVDVHRPLEEYGLSSRDAVELSGDLEELLDQTLPSTLLWDHPTIAALSQALAGNEDGEDTAEQPENAATAQDSGDALDDAIAVVGLGCRLPGGVHGPDEFWQLLDAGRDGIGEVPADRWDEFVADQDPAVVDKVSRLGGFLDDIAGFDAEFFGIAPREAARMDPQQRMMLEVSWEALEHAGIAPESLRGTRTGVFLGISGTEYGQLSLADLSTVDAWTGTGAALSIAANRLSYALDLRGPSVSVDTACSSSLVSVHLAVRSLRTGESDLAMAAGANLLLGPGVTANFHQMGLISASGRCRPFSADADGIVRAEGSAVVVLKRLSDAVADGDRVLSVIRGSAMNSDGRSNGLTAPNPEAQQDLLRSAYADARVRPSDVDYVEAHGTGTLLGDPIEARALGAVLSAEREHPLILGSVKSNLGHLEAAAGIAGLVKVVLSLSHNKIPKHANYAGPNPHIDFDELRLAVTDESIPWPQREHAAIAGVSGFGFGGTNAHVVLEQATTEPVAPAGTEDDAAHRFLLGASHPDRLSGAASALADWLSGQGRKHALRDIEFTLARRLQGQYRAGLVAANHDELIDTLNALADGRTGAAVVTGRPALETTAPVWVFSGHGSQWAGMGRRLLDTEPAFAAVIDELEPLILRESGFSVRERLLAEDEPTDMALVQPLLFAMQVALAELWRSHGVTPAAVIGHSVGECAAAVVSGALTLAEGAKLVAVRSRLLSAISGNTAMATLEVGADEADELVAGLSDVDVAVFNAPAQTVVTGNADRVDALIERVSARGLFAKRIKVAAAAHSPLVDQVTDRAAAELAGLTGGEARIPFYSTVLDDPRRAAGFDAPYWVANMRRPVRFAHAMTGALRDGHRAFVEISPHPMLAQAITENAEAQGVSDPLVLSTGRRDADERTQFHGQLAALELAGLVPAHREHGQVINLPTTRWEHQPYWLAPARPRRGAAREHPLLGVHVELPDDGRHLWRAEIGTDTLPWLADHQLDDRPVAPASVYLEMAMAAAGTVFGVDPDRIGVGELTTHQLLPLGRRCEVTTTLHPEERGRGRITVHSKDAEDGWRLHAEATVCTVPETSTVDTPGPVPSLPAEAREPRTAEVYDRLHNLGVSYGPAFTGMSAPRVAAGRAVATVARPEPAEPSSHYLLHPALLDSCLQVFSVALAGNEDLADARSLYLPTVLGSVRRYGDPEAGTHCHVSVEPSGTGTLSGALRLVDAGGAVLLEITDVLLRKVSRMEISAPLADRLLNTVWRPVDLPSAGVPQGSWLVLSDVGDPRSGCVTRTLAGSGVWVRHAHYNESSEVGDALRAMRMDGKEPDGIVVLLPSELPGVQGLAEAEQALLSVANLVREVVEGEHAGGGTPPRLWLVTTGASGALENEPVEPAFGSLRGLVRVLAYEHSNLRASWIDLDPSVTAETGIPDLLSELAVGPDDEVAWRGGVRYAARLAPYTLPETEPAPVVRTGGGYIITGGLGGLGLLLAKWLAQRGAGRIVLNGRSEPKPDAAQAIEAIRESGTSVEVVLGDLSEAGLAQRLVHAATEGPVALRGVVHAAAVFDDKIVTRLDAETLHKTWLPKAYGAWRLHEATADLQLDWWVAFASAASLHGLPGQPAYASANAYLDSLVRMRRAAGLPGTSISWGAWAEVGAAAAHDLDVPWLHSFSPADGLNVLESALAADVATVGAIRLNLPRLASGFSDLIDVPFFHDLLADYAGADADSDSWPGVAELRGLDPAEARRLASAQLRTRVASVMGFAPDKLDIGAPLAALGVDSLIAVRIRNAVQHDFGLTLPVSLLLRGASLTEVQAWLFGELDIVDADEPDVGGRAPAAQVVPPRDAAERLVADVWETVLGFGVGVTQDFYGIGGDHESAERVTALLGERSGRELITSELFERPTVELMAMLLRDEAHGSSPVRVLQPGEAGNRPLFLFHPGGGDTGVYRQLVEQLGPEVPVYGFDRLDGVLEVPDRVREYLPKLKEIQPHGPYRLAGWSFGGFMAFEAAQQLESGGDEVEVVVLMDSILPLPIEAGLTEVQQLERRFERFGEFLESAYGGRVDLPYEKLATLGVEEQAQLLTDTIQAAGLINGEVSDAILRHQRDSFVDARALELYRPPLYQGRVVFYSAAELVPGGLRDARFDRVDPARGWDQVCTDMDVVTVTGHHLSLLDPPNVDRIAAHLDVVLRSVSDPVGSRAGR